MTSAKSKTSAASEPTPATRFATKRTGSKPAKVVRGQQVLNQSKSSESFERISKGKDVIFSGAWKPGRVLSSK